jgi:hypothetical protein
LKSGGKDLITKRGISPKMGGALSLRRLKDKEMSPFAGNVTCAADLFAAILGVVHFRGVVVNIHSLEDFL